MRAFAAVLAFLAVTVAAPAFASDHELFRVERSVNGNIVRYDARVRSDGTLDPRRPVTAYWVLAGRGNQREALSALERSLAYGFSLVQTQEGLTMRLVACNRRVVVVRRGPDGWHAELVIRGKPAILRSIWVQVEPGFLAPRVSFIELRGVDRSTGTSLTERLDDE
jgi:hypothetical protein